MSHKQCIECKTIKPTIDFYKKNKVTGELHTYCKPCSGSRNRNNELKRLYGITTKDYDAMYSKQNGSCAICHTHQSKRRKTFAVDHCHKTGVIRGLLCHQCNNAVGLLQDDAKIFDRGARYLRDSLISKRSICQPE